MVAPRPTEPKILCRGIRADLAVFTVETESAAITD
jgi:hypothetical protein